MRAPGCGIYALAEKVEEALTLDPTRIVLLDLPTSTLVTFNARALFEGSQQEDWPTAIFIMATRHRSKKKTMKLELRLPNHRLARAGIKEKEIVQKFSPVLVYVSTVGTKGPDQILQILSLNS